MAGHDRIYSSQNHSSSAEATGDKKLNGDIIACKAESQSKSLRSDGQRPVATCFRNLDCHGPRLLQIAKTMFTG